MSRDEHPRLRLRDAGPADFAPLLELARRTFIDTFARFNNPQDFTACLEEHYAPDRFANDLTDANTRTVLAEDGQSGQPAAYVRLRWGNPPVCVGDPDALEIEKFYVDRPWFAQGVGSMLMIHCLKLAEASGRRTIYLSVWEHNARAIRFYEKWGFRRVGQHTFMVGSDPQIDWWMSRAVAPVGDRGPSDRG